jgi:hypothetical protein
MSRRVHPVQHHTRSSVLAAADCNERNPLCSAMMQCWRPGQGMKQRSVPEPGSYANAHHLPFRVRRSTRHGGPRGIAHAPRRDGTRGGHMVRATMAANRTRASRWTAGKTIRADQSVYTAARRMPAGGDRSEARRSAHLKNDRRPTGRSPLSLSHRSRNSGSRHARPNGKPAAMNATLSAIPLPGSMLGAAQLD